MFLSQGGQVINLEKGGLMSGGKSLPENGTKKLRGVRNEIPRNHVSQFYGLVYRHVDCF
jgi:hypothetical protein